MTTELIVAAMQATGSSDPVVLVDAARQIQVAVSLFELIGSEDTKRFGGKIIAVDRIKTRSEEGKPLAGKARISYHPTNEPDKIEEIETDWLSDPIALHIAKVAKANIDQTVLLFKFNAPDPSGKVSHGFRRCVWIEGPNRPDQTAQAGGNRGEGERAPTTAPSPSPGSDRTPVEEPPPAAPSESRAGGEVSASSSAEQREMGEPPARDPYEPISEEERGRIVGLKKRLDAAGRKALIAWQRDNQISVPPTARADYEALLEFFAAHVEHCAAEGCLKQRADGGPFCEAHLQLADGAGAKVRTRRNTAEADADEVTDKRPQARKLSDVEQSSPVEQVFGEDWDAAILKWEGEYPDYEPESVATKALAEWDAYLDEAFPDGDWGTMNAAQYQTTLRKIDELRSRYSPIRGADPETEPF